MISPFSYTNVLIIQQRLFFFIHACKDSIFLSSLLALSVLIKRKICREFFDLNSDYPIWFHNVLPNAFAQRLDS